MICDKCKKYCENRGHPEVCDYGIKTQKLRDFLEEHDIGLEIWACGCCDSPQVKVTFKGEIVVDEEEFVFSNIEANEPKLDETLSPKECVIDASGSNFVDVSDLNLTVLTCQTNSVSSLLVDPRESKP
jgi:hypothetical protein